MLTLNISELSVHKNGQLLIFFYESQHPQTATQAVTTMKLNHAKGVKKALMNI